MSNGISRLHLLLILFALAVLNPFTFYVLHVTRTYFWVVPLTLAIWLWFEWPDLESDPRLERRAQCWEILLGLAILSATVARCLLQAPQTRIFGLFDMLAVFVALCFALFGFSSLRSLWVPALFLAIMGVGYSVERFLVDSLGYAESLAKTVASLVRLLGGQAASSGAEILLPKAVPARLLVDYGCTGIKGILAFGFIACIPVVKSQQGKVRKLAWIVVALLGFCLASVVRLVIVCFAVIAWGQVAVDYHTLIGFGFFMIWLVLVTWLGSGPRQAPKQDEALLQHESE